MGPGARRRGFLMSSSSCSAEVITALRELWSGSHGAAQIAKCLGGSPATP